METIKLYRRRYIPNEIIYLKDDKILYADNEKIVTRWKALRPRPDFYGGISVCYIKEGYKVSRKYDKKGNTVCFYCDIIETLYDKQNNTYTFNDLLADIIIHKNGQVEVVDLDELADAYKDGLITKCQLDMALRQLDKLLKIIYSKGVKSLISENDYNEW